MFSSSIHLPKNFMNSLFLMAESYSIVYIYHIFCIYSSIEGHMGSLQLLAIIHRAAMNIVEHVSFLHAFYIPGNPLGICPGVVLQGPPEVLCPVV